MESAIVSDSAELDDVISMRWYALDADEAMHILYRAYWSARVSLIDNSNPYKAYNALTRWSYVGQSKAERERREDFGKIDREPFEGFLKRKGLL